MGAQLGKELDVNLLLRQSVDSASNSSGNATEIQARREAERIQSKNERTNAQGSDTDREDEITASKVHWSQTVVAASADASKLLEDDENVFQSLKKKWPSECCPQFSWQSESGQSNVHAVPFPQKSFWNWHHDDFIVKEEPFAAGGQADIFNACGVYQEGEFVLKVFRDGCRLQDLQKQWPKGMLGDKSTRRSGYFSGGKFCNKILGATMMKNGRFAFVMEKCATDLKRLIDHRMTHNGGQDPPFPNDIALKCMWQVAKGMQDLHKRDLIHRDLKAANVLIQRASQYREFDPIRDKKFTCKLADFECSVGVMGTRSWMAPEILQYLKDGGGKTFEEFTKESDVYSYTMICFEILTGKIPFQGFEKDSYSVIRGDRPKLPSDILPWLEELLFRCWDGDTSKRPSFEEIVQILETNADCELE